MALGRQGLFVLLALGTPPLRTVAFQCRHSSSTGFGSFHSDDVEVLIRQALPAPPLPFGFSPTLDHKHLQAIEFGGNRSKALFSLSKDWVFLNHGAFGAALNDGMRLANAWRNFAEEQPLRFYDRVLFPHLVHSHKSLAKFINCPAQDLVLVPNATYGLNAVFNSLDLRRGDRVLVFDTAYGSVKTMLSCLCQEKESVLEVIPVKFPIQHPSELVAAVRERVKADAKVLVIDATTSNSAINFPVLELARLAKEAGLTVVVDGAHGLLAQDLDMSELEECGVDFYVSNCHKWLSSPKSVGFIWRRKGENVDPVVVSHGKMHGWLSSFM